MSQDELNQEIKTQNFIGYGTISKTSTGFGSRRRISGRY